MSESKFFKAQSILPGVTCITGLGMENCYLVEGSEKALLIDTLTGVGNLKAFVRELTDLPVELWDERSTTVSAHQFLNATNTRGKKRKAVVDAVAATIILENYMAYRRLKG